MLKSIVAAGLLAAVAGSSAWAAEEQQNQLDTRPSQLHTVELTDQLTRPWGMAFLPGGQVLITEKAGRLRVFDPDSGLRQAPVAGLPQVAVEGQGGLLDVELHPDFKNNRLVYLSYSAGKNDRFGTEVARGKLNADLSRLENVEVIFAAQPKVEGGQHFGSRLVFDRDGHLFITLGDRGLRDPAQDLESHIGALVRLHDDGSVPEDNPFVGRDDAQAAIYSYGHRNLQGAALHPETGRLWTHEHGPQGGDEINKPEPGKNYGWPTITYGVNYGTGTPVGEGTEKGGMEQPLYYWVPSIAPSGMTFYTGDKFSRWQGDILVGSLKFQLLVRLVLQDGAIVDEERMLEGKLGRIRDVAQGPDGYVYVLTDSKEGKLVRLEPADSSR